MILKNKKSLFLAFLSKEGFNLMMQLEPTATPISDVTFRNKLKPTHKMLRFG